MPPNADWVHAIYDGAVLGLRAGVVKIECFGIQHSPLQPVPPGPIFYLQYPEGDRVMATNVQAWHVGVHLSGTDSYGEVRWHPNTGIQKTIRNLEGEANPRKIVLLTKALTWLEKGIPKAGREPGGLLDEYTLEDLFNEYRAMAEEYKDNGLRKPDDVAFAARLFSSRPSLWRRLGKEPGKEKMTWKRFVRLATKVETR